MGLNRNSILILILISVCISLAAQAQDAIAPAADSAVQENQPTAIATDSVWTDEVWEKARKEIDYKKEVEEEEEEEQAQESGDSSFLKWLKALFASGIFRIVVIALIAGLLFWLILQFIGRKDDSAKTAKGILILDENPEELPEESDLEKHLRLALEAGDYKGAVRILYLIILQRLNENQLIIWKKDKTNRDYLNEVRLQSFYKTFSDITLVYEIIWYGDITITRDEYTRISNSIRSFSETIHGRDKK